MKKDDKIGGDRPVRFSRAAAKRVGRVVRAYEQGDRSMPAQGMHWMPDDPEPIRIGKTMSTWTKGTTATITLWDEGGMGTEAVRTEGGAETLQAQNLLCTVESGRFVLLGFARNLGWYLLNWECAGSSSGGG